jgi:hypothetical protein
MITKKDRAAAAENALSIMMSEASNVDEAVGLAYWAGIFQALKKHSGYLSSETIDATIADVQSLHGDTFNALYSLSLTEVKA